MTEGLKYTAAVLVNIGFSATQTSQILPVTRYFVETAKRDCSPMISWLNPVFRTISQILQPYRSLRSIPPRIQESDVPDITLPIDAVLIQQILARETAKIQLELTNTRNELGMLESKYCRTDREI